MTTKQQFVMGISYHGTVTTNCFAAYDGNGNVVALVNAADGTVAANYEYDPFGQMIRRTGPMASANPMRFSTQYADDNAKDIKYLYRDYSPNTGRWLCRDSIEEQGGANLYGVVGNSPVTRFDENGDIFLDSALDVLVLSVDMSTGAGASQIALDVAALAISVANPTPVPIPVNAPTILRILKGQKMTFRLVDHAPLSAVAEVTGTRFKGIVWGPGGLSELPARPQRATVVLEYRGRQMNQAGNIWFKHFAYFKGDADDAKKASAGPVSYFAPGVDDNRVRTWIDEALRKQRADFSQTFYSQLDGYVYDTEVPVGYSDGDCTTKIQLDVGRDGSVHAYPTQLPATPGGSVVAPPPNDE
jgi:RHS repeat-associated protein